MRLQGGRDIFKAIAAFLNSCIQTCEPSRKIQLCSYTLVLAMRRAKALPSDTRLNNILTAEEGHVLNEFLENSEGGTFPFSVPNGILAQLEALVGCVCALRLLE